MHQELGKRSTEYTNDTHSGTHLTIVETINRSMKYPSQLPQAQELNQAISVFIAKGMHLILTVEEPDFVSMLNKLNPRYLCPIRQHFSEVELPCLYSHVRDSKVKPKLEDAAYCLLTLDLWTSTAHDPYLSVTIHFIDTECCLKIFCLEISALYDDHSYWFKHQRCCY